jgi:hypothetical protein
MQQQKPRICILTLAIGADYRKALQKALESKKAYSEKWGYDYYEFHEERWNRDRSIAWSKVPIWKEFAGMTDKYDYIWISDADVLITNPERKLEEWVIPRLPQGKDLLMCWDSCGTPNSGNMIVRCGSWAVDFFERVWNQEQFLYHIWWEQMAMVHLFQTNPGDAVKLEMIRDAYVFNAFLKGLPGTRLWEKGDFVVHFAGVYDQKLMSLLIDRILAGEVPRISMNNEVIA